jgi:DNA repair protein RadC
MELVNTNSSNINLSNLGEFSVEYKYHSNLKDRPKIKTSRDAYEIAKNVFDMKKIGLQEQIVVLYLNNSNIVIGCCNLNIGALTGVVVDIRHILASALKLMATGILLFHNHPSGKMIASEQDKILTNKLEKALDLLDIKLLDHIIISPFDEYLSLKDEGIF